MRDKARLDISVRRFWTKYQMTFFDISVFNSSPNRYKGKTIQQCYRTNEMEKKQKSNESILLAENGSFTPLVFSVNGGVGE